MGFLSRFSAGSHSPSTGLKLRSARSGKPATRIRVERPRDAASKEVAMAKSPRWAEWTGIGLGTWLVASPWALGFSQQTAPTVNALVTGGILVLGEFFELIIQAKNRNRVHGGTYHLGKNDHGGRNDGPEPLLGLS